MPIKDLVHISLFAALMAALALFPPITIPAIGVPITAQSMGVMFAGGILGARKGGLSILLFLVLVAIGLPLLSGGRGGIGVFAGPTAGFMLGWVVGAFVTGLLTERAWAGLTSLKAFGVCVIGGIGVVYLLGIPWLSLVANISIDKAIIGSAAFIPGDLLKAAAAAAVIIGVKRAYPLIAPASRDQHSA